MSLISVESVGVAYGVRQILSEVTFGVGEGEKAAIVGPNGSGKSTLVRLILGEEQPDSGRISRRNGLRLAALSQNPEFDANLSLLQTVLEARADILEALSEWEEATKAGDVDRISILQERLESLNAWRMEDEARAALKKLGFEDANRPVRGLSGGEQKKLALARLFFEPADMLILDEPTNHLDVQAIEWLEDRLRSFAGAVLLITHDRYFLERVCSRILELHRCRIISFEGNYTDWLEARALREDIEDRTQKSLQSFLKRELQWVRRQPRARGTKSRSRIDRFEEAKDDVLSSTEPLEAFRFTPTQRLGNIILEWGQLGLSFGDRVLFRDSSYKMLKQERIGIIGPNGAGKSSFLNVLLETLPGTHGYVKHGLNTRFSILDQQRQLPVPDGTVMEQVRSFSETAPGPNGSRMGLQPFLEKFGFSGDTWGQKASQLSGGERARLLMACMVAQGANFLILDEPTNDLDLDSMRLLEEALIGFEGCSLIVSHDRWFLDRVATSVLEIGDAPVPLISAGNYSVFQSLKSQRSQSDGQIQPSSSSTAPASVARRSTKKLFGYKEKRELEALEPKIDQAESRLAELRGELEAQSSDYEAVAELSTKLQQQEQELEALIQRWSELEEMREQDAES